MEKIGLYTVDLLIFACLDFSEFGMLELINFDYSSAIIIIIFAKFLNSRILADVQYIEYC